MKVGSVLFFLAFAAVLAGVYFLFPYLRPFVFALGLLGLIAVCIAFAIRRGKMGLLFIPIAASALGIFLLWRIGMQQVNFEKSVGDNLRSLGVAKVSGDTAIADKALAALDKLRATALYHERHEEKLKGTIDSNDFLTFRNHVNSYRKDKNLVELGRKFELFKSGFPLSPVEKDFAAFIDNERLKLAAAREEEAWKEIIEGAEYEAAFERMQRFAERYPTSRYLDSIRAHVEKLNLQKLKSLQGVSD